MTMTMPTSKWEQRLRRLAAMGGGELYDRIRQQLTVRADAARHALGLSFDPEIGPAPAQAPRFFFSPEQVPSLCALLQQRLPREVEQIVRRAERICQHHFDFLGYQDLDYGAAIDWHLDAVHRKRAPRKPAYKIRYLDFEEVGDSKVTWELGRHQHWVTLAKAYRLTGREEFAAEIFRQWQHWQAENPYPIGIHWTSSLEVAFRSLSWIWTYYLLLGSPVLPTAFRAEWAVALGINGRHIETYLSTYFSPNTHLLGEGLALFFIGTLCPELQSASRWKQRGWEIICAEARRQVRSDGFHFEQSTYYHVYALDMFLHAAILASLQENAGGPELDATLERMLNALMGMGRGGTPPSFGDDDGGRLFDPARNRAEHLLDPLSTGAVLFGRGDFKQLAGNFREESLWLLGQQGAAEFDRLVAKVPAQDSMVLQAAGFYAMSDGKQQLIVDCGPQGAGGAGHGHADALSVCLNSDGKALLIDPGTLEYVGPELDRDLFRLTAAHNTLSVDGRGQSDPNGPFAWMHPIQAVAEAWVNGETFDLFIGSHDGYSRLPQPVLHRRWIFYRKSDFWLVRDIVLGEGPHQLDLFWHLHPSLSTRDGISFQREDGAGLCIVTPETHIWTGGVVQGQHSPAYGMKQSAPVLHFGTVAELPAQFVSLLQPVSGSQTKPGKLRKLDAEHFVHAYRYDAGEEQHFFFFARSGTSWSYGPWKTDAEFLYWSQSRSGRRQLIVCQASTVENSGKALLTCPHPVLRCEIIREAEQVQVFCPDGQVVVRKEWLPTADLAEAPAPPEGPPADDEEEDA